MTPTTAYLGLGSNAPDAPTRLASALRALAEAGERLAAVARPVWSPYEEGGGRVRADVPRVLDTVAEVRTGRAPRALLDLLARVEETHGRHRDDPARRALDLDLLAWGDRVDGAGPVLPHPRALDRAFVLAPWAEIAPLAVVPGTGATVVEHVARLRVRRPEAFAALEAVDPPPWPRETRGPPRVLEDVAALSAWRAALAGTVGVVPTMGALHAGHEALVRRARAECDHVVATLFVNPLQFGAGEDLARYPRTFPADRDLLERAGADAVYAPAPEDLYPQGFATYVVPEGPAAGFEGALRPGHFRGVATVVWKLLARTSAHRAYFGRKDAQQLAVVRRMVRDLDVPVEIVTVATVRERDGLALSSRNRYLSPDERERAAGLPRALEAMVEEAAVGRGGPEDWVAGGRRRLAEAGLEVDYVDVVDADTFQQVETLVGPGLAVAAARVGSTRLIDNRWLAPGVAPGVGKGGA